MLEVGLGGRLDATNVCFPAVTAITTIDFDHVASLGNTLGAIAAEKAGIIKPEIPLVLGAMPEEPRRSSKRSRRAAARRSWTRRRASRCAWSSRRGMGSSWRSPAASSFVGGARAASRQSIKRRMRPSRSRPRGSSTTAPETWEPMLAGLARTRWPGRLERVAEGGAPTRVYDVAHNAGGAAALVAALDDLGIPAGSVLVIGVLDDKDLAGMAAPLARHFRRAVAVTPPHPLRARPAAETAGVLRAAGIETAGDPRRRPCDPRGRRARGERGRVARRHRLALHGRSGTRRARRPDRPIAPQRIESSPSWLVSCSITYGRPFPAASTP